jgi:hypothetical protein
MGLLNGLNSGQLNDILKANATASTDQITAAQKRAQDDKLLKTKGEQDLAQGLQSGDLALRNLLQGKTADQTIQQAKYAKELETAQALRGQYGSDVNVDAGDVKIGARDPLRDLLKKRELSQPLLTKGQEAADTAFGKEYADFNAGGGSESAKKSIGLLESAQNQLKARGNEAPNFFERAVQYGPDSVRAALTPDIKAQEDQVRTAIQSSLRQTLGAQFTEKEGEQLMRRAYDPRLSAQQNLAKLAPEIDALKAQIARKMQSAQQFERTGSLVGLGAAGAQPSSPQAVRKQYSPSRNKTKITYSDGREEIVDGRQ